LQFEERTISSREVFKGNIIRVRVDDVELPGGRKSRREIVEHDGGVVIIPVNKQREILLVEQFRKPVEQTLLELPAGKLEKGEEPLSCARRELLEETGYSAGKIEHLLSFYTTPGFSDEILHLFLAEDLIEGELNPDEDEIIKLHKVMEDNINEYIYREEIQDGKTIMGLLIWMRRRAIYG